MAIDGVLRVSSRYIRAEDQILEKLPRFTTERPSQSQYVQKGDVSLASLDASKVTTRDPALQRQLFLRPSPFFPKFRETLAEPLQFEFLLCGKSWFHPIMLRTQPLCGHAL